MNRRSFLISLAAAGLIMPLPALAQDAQTRVIRRLQREGYRNIRISRTFLGRIRIMASGTAGEREVILNPSTGAIVRDVMRRTSSGGGSERDSDGGSSQSLGSTQNDGDGADDNDDSNDDGDDGGGGSAGSGDSDDNDDDDSGNDDSDDNDDDDGDDGDDDD